MEYSTYFGEAVKCNGVPYLNQEQFSLMMNIIVLENQIHGMEDAHSYFQENEALKYMTKNKRVSLTRLTLGLKPDTLFERMVQKSIHETPAGS